MQQRADIVVIVTGSGGPLGANVTRSLRDSALPIRTVGTEANRWHLPLSLCDSTWLIPRAGERRGYVAALAEIARAEEAAAILPTHPVEVRAVAELRDRGELGALGVALPRTEVIELAGDKAATHARLAGCAVPVPRTRRLAEPADVDRAFEELGRPVWVRGTGAPGLGIGGAALPCRDPDVAKAWVRHHDGWGKMAASEFLPGRNLTWMAGFRDGVLIACAARERLEYVLPHVSPSGITGAPAVTRTIRRGDMARIGRAAVEAIDRQPHGVYFVDMTEDAGGAPRVTEINAGRCGTTVHFYTRAGYNFPELLVRLAIGDAVEPLSDPDGAVAPGQYWVRTLDCGPELLGDEAEFERFPRAGFADE